MKKILFSLIVAMVFVTVSRAQTQIDKSQYEWKWAPLSNFIKYEETKGMMNTIIRKITFVDTTTPISAISFKNNEEILSFLSKNIYFSEQPNGQEAGYYVANTEKMTISIGNKKNKIDVSGMQALGNGQFVYKFGENLVLYLRKVNDEAAIKNIMLCYGKPIKFITISPFTEAESAGLNPPTNIQVNQENPIVVDYKDENGRIWNYKGKEWSVQYPDGSYCSSKTNGERRLRIGKAEISGDYPDGSFVAYYNNEPRYCKRIYPDGMVVQFFDRPKRSNYEPDFYNNIFAGRVDEKIAERGTYVDMGNGLMVEFRDAIQNLYSMTEEHKDSLKLPYYGGRAGYFPIYSKTYDFKSMSKQELKKLLDEKFFPYTLKEVVTGKNHWGDIVELYRYDARDNIFAFCDYETGDEIAKYSKGEILTKEDKEARNKKIHEDLDKDYSYNINLLKKKYGAKYVDAAMKGQLLVGMPFDLLLEKDFWQYWDGLTVDTKGHYMAEYSWLVYNYNKALGIYKAEQLRKSSNIYVQSHTYIIWVRNGKITQINK